MSLLKKLGLSYGGLEDPQFKELRKTFEASLKSLDKIGEQISAFLCQADELLKSQKKLVDTILGQEITGDSRGSVIVQKNQVLMDRLMLENKKLNELSRTQIQDPLNKYKGYYREIQDRIRERARRGEESVRLSSEAKKYREKNDPRLAGTTRRLESAKRAYEDLHNELSEDIPLLLADREVFLAPITAASLNIMIDFYQNMNKELSDIQSEIPPVDINALINHPRVFRTRQESAISRNYSALETKTLPSTYNPNQQYEGVTTTQMAANPSYLCPLPPARPSAVPSKLTAHANWGFEAQNPDELSFNSGDILEIVERDGDWWVAKLNGRQGLIPANYVSL